MTPFSRPACTADVNYTVTQKATVPHEKWVTFVLAITEVFWQLPKNLRPSIPLTVRRRNGHRRFFRIRKCFFSPA